MGETDFNESFVALRPIERKKDYPLVANSIFELCDENARRDVTTITKISYIYGVLKCSSNYNMKHFNSTASDSALESSQQLSSFQ